MTSWQKLSPDSDHFLDSEDFSEADLTRATGKKQADPLPTEEDPLGPAPKIPPIDRMNRIDLVAYFFSQGKTIPQIVKILETDYGLTDIKRELPYHDLAYAANHRWLSYDPPRTVGWTNEIRHRCTGLLEASVPNWGGRMAVITESAKLVGRSIYHIARTLAEEYALEWGFPVARPPGEPRRSRKNVEGSEEPEHWTRTGSLPESDPDDPHPVPMELEVRIGVSGGDTMGKTTSVLGQVLETQIEDWEKDLKERVFKSLEDNHLEDLIPKGAMKRRFKVRIRLLFVNLVTGFGTSPGSHPIAFLTSMIEKNKRLTTRASVKCFNAAPFVRIGEREDFFEEFTGAKKVREFVQKYGLDIILTSAGSIDDPHSVFQRYYAERGGTEKAESAYELLTKYRVEGDFLWQPITAAGPINLSEELPREDREKLKFSPMSLLTLDDVIAHRRAGRDVVLVLGPCGKCGESKEQVLKAIFGFEESIVSHLAVDRISAARALGRSDTPPPPPPPGREE